MHPLKVHFKQNTESHQWPALAFGDSTENIKQEVILHT